MQQKKRKTLLRRLLQRSNLSPDEFEKALITDLQRWGVFVCDHFLSEEELAGVAIEFEELHLRGKFKRAGIGKLKDFHVNEEIRKDETLWLESAELSDVQNALWDKLDVLKRAINETLFLGLWSLEGHYAYYPVGGFYKKHIDRFSQDDTRTISMVLYLNSEWKESDGGQLRIHHPDLSNGMTDISPLGGRLVCFLSSQIEHEVLPATRIRRSFAGWWKRRSSDL